MPCLFPPKHPPPFCLPLPHILNQLLFLSRLLRILLVALALLAHSKLLSLTRSSFLRLLCTRARSARSLETTLAMPCASARAIALRGHSKLPRSLRISLALRLRSLCALARNFSISLALPFRGGSSLALALRVDSIFFFFTMPLRLVAVVVARSLEKFSLDRFASRLLCACARFARSLETSLSVTSLASLCLALALLRLCSICVLVRKFLSLAMSLCLVAHKCFSLALRALSKLVFRILYALRSLCCSCCMCSARSFENFLPRIRSVFLRSF